MGAHLNVAKGSARSVLPTARTGLVDHALVAACSQGLLRIALGIVAPFLAWAGRLRRIATLDLGRRCSLGGNLASGYIGCVGRVSTEALVRPPGADVHRNGDLH